MRPTFPENAAIRTFVLRKALMKNKKQSRFSFIFDPITTIDENDDIRRPDFPFSAELMKRRYPVRALRYWWLDWAVRKELEERTGPAVIVDVGCDRGIIKRFVKTASNARWIGLDIDTAREGISLANYDELVRCDFDSGFPIANGTADIVICSHVLEHLQRADHAMDELVRIVKPGGLLLIGVPTAPKIIAQVRERQFARQLNAGTRKRGQHVHAFWGKRLRQMAESRGMFVELSTGTAIIRKNGSRMEDHAAWIRLNQLGAAIFPPLGQEHCLKLRKTNEN